jgi:hypothetical protein
MLTGSSTKILSNHSAFPNFESKVAEQLCTESDADRLDADSLVMPIVL